MASFSLPPIQPSSKAWGPTAAQISEDLKDIPYAPYSKSDKLGRVADWNQGESHAGASGGAGGPGARGGGPGQQRYGKRGDAAAYGSGAVNSFSYFHMEDEQSFSVVDTKSNVPIRRGGPGGRGRGAAGGRGAGGRGGYGNNRGGPGNRNQAGRRPGWREWDKPSRTRESSVTIGSEWNLLEEIDFGRLTKLRLDVEEPVTLSTHGRLFAYDKMYDRITTKAERPLQMVEKLYYNPTTSEDTVIQELAKENKATVYATDQILSWLMTASRSLYSWDIVITREGDKLFFDKREGSPLDYITVNENATDPPMEGDKDSINAPGSLSLEATFVDSNFSIQAVKEDTPMAMAEPNPFQGSDDPSDQLASCAYRYRLFDLGVDEEDTFKLAMRTQLNSYIPGPNPNSTKGVQYLTLKALNEFDSRAQGAGGAPDWRSKLDSQRGAVVSTEMKNNSAKLARWAVQSILAGADAMKLGYISRANPRENSKHVILSTSTVRPRDFAVQLNVSLANGWGIVRTVSDLCMKQPEGKYILVKDPNKPLIRLYAVPADAFDVNEGAFDDEDGDEADD